MNKLPPSPFSFYSITGNLSDWSIQEIMELGKDMTSPSLVIGVSYIIVSSSCWKQVIFIKKYVYLFIWLCWVLIVACGCFPCSTWIL